MWTRDDFGSQIGHLLSKREEPEVFAANHLRSRLASLAAAAAAAAVQAVANRKPVVLVLPLG